MDSCDITIPVPWGIISGKSYGNVKNQFVLLVHGRQDNCGSFERLLSLLPQSYYYVCIDLPSHGKSTYIPGNLLIHTMDFVLVYKLIMDYFRREKCILIGHSYGAQIGLLFTQVYPEYVLKLISLDAICLYPMVSQSFKNGVRSTHDEYLKILANQSSPDTKPTYTYEEALEKCMNRSFGEIGKDAAEPMLKRNTEELPNGRYTFTNDPRLKISVNPGFTMNDMVQLIKNNPVKCPHLIVLATETPQLNYFRPVVKALKDTNKNFSLKIVQGSHDVHNENPERVAPLVSKFLTTSKL